MANVVDFGFNTQRQSITASFDAGDLRRGASPPTQKGGSMVTPVAGPEMYRTREGLGIWEHRGKVAAVGIGHSATGRRWDGTPENTIGAWTIEAMRKAMADAGVTGDQVDGIVSGAYNPSVAVAKEFTERKEGRIKAVLVDDDKVVLDAVRAATCWRAGSPIRTCSPISPPTA